VFVKWFCFGLCFSLLACGEFEAPPGSGEDGYGQSRQRIRNGTRDPQVLALTDGQKLAIGWLHPRGSAGANFCTATLVGPRVVATAKHCIEGGGRRGVSFGVGLLPSDPVHSFAVADIHAHDRVDAAILILAEDATAVLPEIVPIRFNRDAPNQTMVGREVEAAGYGETYDASRSGRYFAVVQLTRVTSSEVVVDGRGRQGICFGDSGGPVMTTNEGGEPVVLGVESWGDPSCWGVDHLTRLDTLADWIDDLTGSSPDAPEPCGEVEPDGQCGGDVFQWCQDGQLRRRDCTLAGLECRGPGDGAGGCFEPDPCEGITSAGVCDGGSVVRCRFSELVREHCAEAGLGCDSDEGGAFCGAVEPIPAPPPEMEDPLEEATPDGRVGGGEIASADAGLSNPSTTSREARVAEDGCAAVPTDDGHPALGALLVGLLLGRRRRHRPRSP
jgi:MYXO-CTERM domain-containing protein